MAAMEQFLEGPLMAERGLRDRNLASMKFSFWPFSPVDRGSLRCTLPALMAFGRKPSSASSSMLHRVVSDFMLAHEHVP